MQHTSPWFRTGNYGFGWMPVCWQGWLSLLLYLGVIFVLVVWVVGEMRMGTRAIASEDWLTVGLFIVGLIGATTALLALSYHKGDPPRLPHRYRRSLPPQS
jgi:NADH:ubiquinone oxidoreductase subunit 6 (subunit J)